MASLAQPRRRRARRVIQEQLVAQLDELIAGSDTLPIMKRGRLRERISTKSGLNQARSFLIICASAASCASQLNRYWQKG